MGADGEALLRLWREKRGEAEPQDYSGNLTVQLGVATEALNRPWFERTTGQIRCMAATLDGVVEGTGAVFEAKFIAMMQAADRDDDRIKEGAQKNRSAFAPASKRDKSYDSR
jgi:hypothetical protein